MKTILAELNTVITSLEEKGLLKEASELNDVFMRFAQQAPAQGQQIYTVQKDKEKLSDIANKYKIFVKDILIANPDLKPNTVTRGKQIIIPAKNYGPGLGVGELNMLVENQIQEAAQAMNYRGQGRGADINNPSAAFNEAINTIISGGQRGNKNKIDGQKLLEFILKGGNIRQGILKYYPIKSTPGYNPGALPATGALGTGP